MISAITQLHFQSGEEVVLRDAGLSVLVEALQTVRQFPGLYEQGLINGLLAL